MIKKIIPLLILLMTFGCVTGEQSESDNLGENKQSAKTYYFLGIPVYEHEVIQRNELPE